jgi:hypothetical protein
MAKKETPTASPVAEQSVEQTPGLTLQDLVFVAQIIQLTSQRGAYKAEEMAQVGGLYNKLIAFLQTTGALAPAAAPTEETN